VRHSTQGKGVRGCFGRRAGQWRLEVVLGRAQQLPHNHDDVILAGCHDTHIMSRKATPTPNEHHTLPWTGTACIAPCSKSIRVLQLRITRAAGTTHRDSRWHNAGQRLVQCSRGGLQEVIEDNPSGLQAHEDTHLAYKQHHRYTPSQHGQALGNGTPSYSTSKSPSTLTAASTFCSWMVTALERHKAVTEALGASTTARLATATASRSAATAVTHRYRLTTSSHTCHCKIISVAHAHIAKVGTYGSFRACVQQRSQAPAALGA